MVSLHGEFRQTFYQNLVQRRVLYKLVLVTYPLNHFRRIFSPSNLTSGLFKKQKKTNVTL